jgi:transcriptional regulator of acetoin/glycerol metabolism
LEEILQHLCTVAQEWDVHLDEIDHNNSYSAPIVQGRIGRPRFNISRDQLEYLSSMSFTWTQIASMLGVSRMTVYRRRIECGIPSRPGHVLSDDDLGIVLEELSADMPAMGETMMWD